jgi:Sugar-transfer associated ATP-grasp
MLAESPVIVRSALRFLALPYCFFFLVNWKECARSAIGVVSDFLYIFFRLKCYPDNYSACRLDEKPRETWSYYYGSTYNPHPRKRLRKDVQRYDYQVIFNDKSVSELVCRGVGLRLPRYFGELEPTEQYARKISTIFMSNEGMNKIILKPVMGHAGRGIDVAYRSGSEIVVKTGASVIPLNDYRLQSTVIVQEYIQQHSRLAAISSSSVNTIRLVTLWTKAGETILISAAMRFGVGNAHVDNWSSGGIAVGVDHHTGRLMEVAFDKHGNRFHVHPDSKHAFLGFQLPFWEETVAIATKLQEAANFYRLIGVDVAITDDGPMLIEMNANPDIVFQEQTAGPLLRDPRVLREFAEYGLLYNDAQLRLMRHT